MTLLFKRLCCGLLWLLLVLPAGQARFKWLAEEPLQGAFKPAPDATFSWSGLLANTYQPALERSLDDRLGFRALFIRLRNELSYYGLGESGVNNIVVGRGGVLFGRDDLDAYLGTDFVGEAVVRRNARRLRAVQDSLARHGTALVFVIAPSHATCAPESLPSAVRRQPRSRTNAAAYAAELSAAGVHVLDFSPAFGRWKARAPYPLFAPGGFHWSMYGGARAADSLARYLRQTLRVAPAPFRLADDLNVSPTPRETDDDLLRTLNLLRAPAPGPLAYPRLDFGPPPAAAPAAPAAPAPPKPNALLVADSFGWTWVYNSFFDNAFSDKSRYWYYNAEVVWPGAERTPEGRDLGQLKQRAQYLSRQVIVLLFNERNLVAFDKGFSREVFDIFHPLSAADHARYDALVAARREQATWEESVKEGFERGLSDYANGVLADERLDREVPERPAPLKR